MLLDFYGFREQPFGVTPDPRFIFETPAYREAWASLWYGIEAQRGFMALIAEPGMGKTTLLFRLLEDLRGSTRTAFVFQNQCDPEGFLRGLVSELGCATSGQPALASDRTSLQEALNEFLIRESQAGQAPVIIIDEAQALPDSVLEAVRLLSNFENPRAKLLQIILAGQRELAERLATPQLTPLRQRISLVSRLCPLPAEAVGPYLDHRVRVAGYLGPPLFTASAYALLAQLSGGVPRNLNNICFSALSLGCALGRRQIDVDILREVELDLDWGKMAQPAPATTAPAARQEPSELRSGASSHQVSASPDARIPQDSASAPRPTRATSYVPARSNVHAAPVSTARLEVPVPQTRRGLVPYTPAPDVPLRQWHPAPAAPKRRAQSNVSWHRATLIACAASAVLVVALVVTGWRSEPAIVPGPIAAATSATEAEPVRQAAQQPRPETTPQTPDPSSHRGAVAGRSMAGGTRFPGHKRRVTGSRSIVSTVEIGGDYPTPTQRKPGEDHAIADAATSPSTNTKTIDAPPHLGPAIGPANASLIPLIGARSVAPLVPRPATPDSDVFRKNAQGKLLLMVKPEYPLAARKAGIEGFVRLRAAVGERGQVTRVRVVDGNPELAEAAVAAVKHWRYVPSYLDGRPIPSERDITVEFTLRANR